MSVPEKVGLTEFIRKSQGCQFVIPVYQRNYTWKADNEVKRYLDDLKRVLKGDYNKHFMGIVIYLEKTISFSEHEFSVIDGQQRLTTIFLTLYAIRKIMKDSNDEDGVNSLDGQYLTNPFGTEKIKYKLKPLVDDDDVYKCIVEDRFGDITNEKSNVLNNYNYIKKSIEKLLANNHTINQIMDALNKLYIVCVPIDSDDNAQKIFESINSTGAKLTAADLIRNYLLMNLDSATQDDYYAKYWKKIEENVSSDSNDLEMFFRTFLAIQKYELVSKKNVYREFVSWVEDNSQDQGELFKEILLYSKIYNTINNSNVASLDLELQVPIVDFRKIGMDIPLSPIMEFFKLRDEGKITTSTLAELVQSIDNYLIRRGICDIGQKNISRLFPTVLKNTLEICDDDFTNIVSIFNQELVGNNAFTSGSYMPTDAQMKSNLMSANVYGRPMFRVILDRLELFNNSAPVDLSKLSIEHVMPQTHTQKWLDDLGVDEEAYYENINRLGNLTLVSTKDNSKMSNSPYDFKQRIMFGTRHIKLNEYFDNIQPWDLKEIDIRTEKLIDDICSVFPYPDVSVVKKQKNNFMPEREAIEFVENKIFSGKNYTRIKRNYIVGDEGYHLYVSKRLKDAWKQVFWYGYKEKNFSKLKSTKHQYCLYVCRTDKITILCVPRELIEENKDKLSKTLKDGKIAYYHIHIYLETDGRAFMHIPGGVNIDITEYILK